ncbi:unnamed protein product [Haemonchus placei]|uniref:Uncharacterized protein n=1 Tax=Haemonchus placei TaxID=6290 RepID=A0A3P7W9C2_HAEPC|nr:unnamed protein product [Haemonchus placei]
MMYADELRASSSSFKEHSTSLSLDGDSSSSSAVSSLINTAKTPKTGCTLFAERKNNGIISFRLSFCVAVDGLAAYRRKMARKKRLIFGMDIRSRMKKYSVMRAMKGSIASAFVSMRSVSS